MPNWTRLIAGWALAAIIAVAFSWGAVGQVRNRVIQPTVEIPTTVAAAPALVPAPPTTTSTPAVVRIEPEPVEATTSTSAAVATTTTTAPSDSTTNPPAVTSTTTTTQAPQTTTTSTTTTMAPPPSPTTTTTTTTPPQTQTESYTVVGGVVTISYSPGVVNFISAIPQPGFGTDPRETGPDRVRIRFESQDHTSDFRAEWEGGELKITKNETGED